MTSTDYSVQVIQSRQELTALRADWDQLFARLAEPAFYHDWRWHECLSRRLFSDIAYYCIRHRAELVAVVPLRPKKAGRSLQLPVSRQTDLTDILLHPGHCNEAVLYTLFRGVTDQVGRWQHVVFERVPKGSSAFQLAQLHRRSMHADRMSKNSFFQTQSVGDLKTLSKKHLKNVNRFQRKLIQDTGDLLFEHRRSDAQSIEDFLHIEHSGWKGSRGKCSSILSDSDVTGFYRDVAQSFAETGQLCLSFASVNQKRISGQFAILTGQRQALLKLSYLPEYGDYAPGNLLLNDTLQAAARDVQVDELNLLTGPGWADRWHPSSTDVYLLSLFNNTLRGWLGYGLLRLKDFLRPFKLRIINRSTK
ncbi:GNAT family N-acetyltransferase [Marinobacter sp. SS21]|uniref:GNAT family N-acetyltransferase n=1 Tax=Marinobacter sp. SS21 TaxID=2979460 RepID=UPI00232CC3EA|nr:GNAT family N-acetyltransferase [Marinobacter sp. SS21]MDC0662074.1 GNAT family N-acetyltransferase [Marinobacter sp. SS21]